MYIHSFKIRYNFIISRSSLSLFPEKPIFSGAIDKQHRTVMGQNKFKRSSLLVSMSKYGRKLYKWRKKETPHPKKLCVTICKMSKFSWPPCTCWTSSMNDLSLSVYVKKWITVFIVNKLILIYFTWFVIYTFSSYKYNVLLKRINVCLMPLSTFITLSRFDEGKEIRIVSSKMA